MRAIIFDEQTGQIIQQVETSPMGIQMTADHLHANWIEYLDDMPDDLSGYQVQAGELVVRQADLAVLRADAWAAIKRQRDSRVAGGCDSPLGRVDTDDVSRANIAGAVQMAMLAAQAGQDFAVDWTMADNSVVEHDAVEMIALGVAVGSHVQACYATGQALRTAIEQADEQGLMALTWPDDAE